MTIAGETISEPQQRQLKSFGVEGVVEATCVPSPKYPDGRSVM